MTEITQLKMALAAVLASGGEERSAALAIRSLVTRIAALETRGVSGGMGSGMSAGHGSQGLSAKDRRNLDMVRDALANDRNPFSKDEMEKRGAPTGGGGSTHLNKPEKPLRKPSLTSMQVRKREEYWRSGVGRAGTGKFLSGAYINAPFSIPPPKGWHPPLILHNVYTDQHHCTFCGKATSLLRATEGTSRPKFQRVEEEVILANGEKSKIEKWKVTSAKFIACPDCSLKIKPSLSFWCADCNSHEHQERCSFCGKVCEATVSKNNVKFHNSEE